MNTVEEDVEITTEKPPRKRHAGGRPSKYKKEFADQLIDYFDVEPYRRELKAESTAYGKNGNETFNKKEYILVANDPPFLIGFCEEIGISMDTLHEWVDKYPEFSDAYARAKELFKRFLVTNGLNRAADSAFTIFTAKNTTDMKDKMELEPSGSFLDVIRQAAQLRAERIKALKSGE